jgi:hypothetical protein
MTAVMAALQTIKAGDEAVFGIVHPCTLGR